MEQMRQFRAFVLGTVSIGCRYKGKLTANIHHGAVREFEVLAGERSMQ